MFLLHARQFRIYSMRTHSTQIWTLQFDIPYRWNSNFNALNKMVIRIVEQTKTWLNSTRSLVCWRTGKYIRTIRNVEWEWTTIYNFWCICINRHKFSFNEIKIMLRFSTRLHITAYLRISFIFHLPPPSSVLLLFSHIREKSYTISQFCCV